MLQYLARDSIKIYSPFLLTVRDRGEKRDTYTGEDNELKFSCLTKKLLKEEEECTLR